MCCGVKINLAFPSEKRPQSTHRRPSGGIGRRSGLKIQWGVTPVRVRVPPRLLTIKGLTTISFLAGYNIEHPVGTKLEQLCIYMAVASMV